MCAICGCSGDHPHDHAHPHAHDHAHPHAHDHAHPHAHDHDPSARTVQLEKAILDKNNRLAERCRGWFEGRGALAINLVSSPGAGKTTLLERVLADRENGLSISVIEGDQAGMRDADRIRRAGGRAVQINTGAGCHLDASMILRCLPELDPPPGSVVMIENVGNLVCPALFDLGERARMVVVSVTEGEDKPLKYPHMFRSSHCMLISKIDLLPHLTFDVDALIRFALEVNPRLSILRVSAKTGEGLADFYAWLRALRPNREAAQ